MASHNDNIDPGQIAGTDAPAPVPKTASTPRAFYVAPEADTAYYAQEILTPEDLSAGPFSLFRRHVVEEAHQDIATGALDSDSAGDMTIPAITSAADGTGHGNILGSTDTDHAIPATIERFAESVFLLDLFHVIAKRIIPNIDLSIARFDTVNAERAVDLECAARNQGVVTSDRDETQALVDAAEVVEYAEKLRTRWEEVKEKVRATITAIKGRGARGG